jgi:hypothetical protein
VTIVRVGTTQVYSEGWEGAFGKGKKPAAASKGKAAKNAKPAAKKGKKKAKK